MSREKKAAQAILDDIMEVKATLDKVPTRREYFEKYGKFTVKQVCQQWGSWLALYNAASSKTVDRVEDARDPKILILDIELLTTHARIWRPDQGWIPHQNIIKQWSMASWAAKWKGKKELFYMDQRNANVLTDDSKILLGLWELIDEADIVITKNGISFDIKKFNSRCVIKREAIGKKGGPSPYLHADVQRMAKKNFGFTHNSLEALCDYLGTEYKKLEHAKFPGMKLWIECEAGNKEAWAEMEQYNKNDVLSTENCFDIMAPWGVPGIDANVFRGDIAFCCPNIACQSPRLQHRGYRRSIVGKYRRYQCYDCGHWTSDKGKLRNLMSEKKKDSLKGR